MSSPSWISLGNQVFATAWSYRSIAHWYLIGLSRSPSCRPVPRIPMTTVYAYLLAAVALQVVHRIDRDVVLEHSVHQLSAFGARPPKPRRCGAAGAAVGAVDAAASTVAGAVPTISSALFTFTVDCSAVWRGFMCR